MIGLMAFFAFHFLADETPTVSAQTANSITMPATLSVPEEAATFTITFTGDPGASVSIGVSVASTDTTATGAAACSTSGADYVTPLTQAGALTNGSSSHSINVLTVCADTTAEADETVVLQWVATANVFDSSDDNCSSGLSCTTTVTIADADGLTGVSYAYQWLADGKVISGATSASYTLTADDQGKRISVTVRFSDDLGNSEILTSAATDPVAGKPQPVILNSPATGAPTISGTAQVGETLTASMSAISDADGLGTSSYQWLAGGNAISGATGSTYTLTDSDEGHAESVTSAATGSVAAKPATSPVGLSVSDARVSEISSPYGQFLEFTVSLDKPAERFVILSFRTRDVTARAASYDYYSHSLTPTFFYGQQEKVVKVYVPPDDGEVGGEETMEPVLYGARGAPIADGVGVGTITD